MKAFESKKIELRSASTAASESESGTWTGRGPELSPIRRRDFTNPWRETNVLQQRHKRGRSRNRTSDVRTVWHREQPEEPKTETELTIIHRSGLVQVSTYRVGLVRSGVTQHRPPERTPTTKTSIEQRLKYQNLLTRQPLVCPLRGLKERRRNLTVHRPWSQTHPSVRKAVPHPGVRGQRSEVFGDQESLTLSCCLGCVESSLWWRLHPPVHRVNSPSLCALCL